MPRIHATAVVHDRARLAPDASVGPFCVVGPAAVLGPGVELVAHVVVDGATELGPNTRIAPFAVVGGRPQHRGDDGADGRVVLGAGCDVREHVTVHRGTGSGVTCVGAGTLLMVGSHVAHDCVLGDRVTLANNVQLGGHVELGDGCWVGGNAGIHQFVRVGAGAFVGGGAVLLRDLLPHAMATGNPACVAGLNLVGLRRAGVSRVSIRAAQAVLETLFSPGPAPLSERALQLQADATDPLVRQILEFARAPGPRRLLRPALP